MNFDELINHLTELHKDSEIAREITKLVGGKKENVVTNLTEIIEDKPLNRAKILEELSDCRHLVNEAQESYESVYDEIDGARDTLDYVASELDELSDAKHRISDLENMIMRDEEPEEEPVKKTPAIKTTFNPTTTQQ